MGEINECLAPTWLTEEYLETVLRKYKKDHALRVTKLAVKPATSKGENYASIMLRIKVDFVLSNCKDVQQGSYIVKGSYESDKIIADIMNPYDIYNTEMLMYEKILPQLTQLLQEIGDQDKLFADTIHVDYEHLAIIFEDLAVSEFVVADRLAGMDMIHAKLALKKLAKMHATAAVLNERCPGILHRFDHGIFNRYTKGFAPFFEKMLEVCADYAAECKELGTYYQQKLLQLKTHVVEYATRVYDVKPTHFCTLNHGDFWINNVMLRYGEALPTNGCSHVKNIKDILIIDFQFCNWASPAVDLHYFLNTSLEGELRLQQQEVLVQHYYTILKQTLQELNYAGHIPTLHEFWVQLECGRFYAVTSSLVCQPLMINDKPEDAEFTNLVLSNERADNFRKLLYTNKVVQENVRTLLPLFDRRGLLEVVEV